VEVSDDNGLPDRLRLLGRVPVDPASRRAHLEAMTAATTGVVDRRWRFGWRAVVAAGVVGFLAGGTGLAAAGTLPVQAQDVADTVLATVGIGVARSTEGCPDGRIYRNHGEYVAEVEAAGGDVEAAAHSSCGKPTHAGTGGGGSANAAPNRPGPAVDADGDPCTGPPPWAGGGMTRQERDLARAERRMLCGADGADTHVESDAADAESRRSRSADAERPVVGTTVEAPTAEPDPTAPIPGPEPLPTIPTPTPETVPADEGSTTTTTGG
jgi:hypothetical protein